MRRAKLPRNHREDEKEDQEMTALRALLAGIVDYAGLFPPAALDMPAAVRNYASYRAEDAAWMLGRFVMPIGRLEEFDTARSALGHTNDYPEWRISGLVGSDPVADIAIARAFNAAHVGLASVDSLEAKLPTAEAIAQAAAASAHGSFSLYAEIPVDPDPAPLLEVIARAGINAKMRTGGLTAEAFPSPEHVVRFIRRCVEADVKFKATAGLHHPIRAEYPLTYDTGAPVGNMFGYLNVFLAAGFMKEGMRDEDAIRLLDETNALAFDVTSSGISWGEFRITAIQLRRIRAQVAVSFGSCSFREPVDELRTLTVLA
jgi:hypothetical protein